MKRLLYIAAFSAIVLTGCSSSSPPQNLDENADIPYISTTTEDISEIFPSESTVDIDIPANYRKMSDKIYAVIENGTISKYMMLIYKNGEYSFIECDKTGKTTITTTQTTITTTVTTTESATETTIETTQPQTQPVTQAESPTPPAVTAAPYIPSATAPPEYIEPQLPPATEPPATVVTTPQPTEPPTVAPVDFTYSIINGLNGLPENVRNTFQLYIDEADVGVPVTKTKKNNDEIYALVYVFEGSPLTIRSVSKDCIITYKLGDSGRKTTCYVVKVTGVQNVAFNKA